MLCATRAIRQKVLEYSGVGPDFCTQRNFYSVLRNVSYIDSKTNEYRGIDALERLKPRVFCGFVISALNLIWSSYALLKLKMVILDIAVCRPNRSNLPATCNTIQTQVSLQKSLSLIYVSISS